jgi:hypothetical protein
MLHNLIVVIGIVPIIKQKVIVQKFVGQKKKRYPKLL